MMRKDVKEIDIMLKVIYTPKAPAAIGLYSQAVVCGDMPFTSGQIPVNPETGEIAGETISEQVNMLMKEYQTVLEESGTNFENAVKTTCFWQIWEIFRCLMKCMQSIL